ncbi:hypothetical protein [Streptomyces sp. NPDC101166]
MLALGNGGYSVCVPSQIDAAIGSGCEPFHWYAYFGSQQVTSKLFELDIG